MVHKSKNIQFGSYFRVSSLSTGMWTEWKYYKAKSFYICATIRLIELVVLLPNRRNHSLDNQNYDWMSPGTLWKWLPDRRQHTVHVTFKAVLHPFNNHQLLHLYQILGFIKTVLHYFCSKQFFVILFNLWSLHKKFLFITEYLKNI